MNESLDLKPNNATEENERIRGRILLAEDEEKIRQMFIEVLAFFGYEVVAVRDGKELLDKLNSGEKFDLVLTDNNMRTMNGDEANGIDALEQIRTISKFNNLPVILQTGALDDELQARVEKLKNSRCLKKPVPINTIKENIEEMIEKATQ